jgi:hypothetical protein
MNVRTMHVNNKALKASRRRHSPFIVPASHFFSLRPLSAALFGIVSTVDSGEFLCRRSERKAI